MGAALDLGHSSHAVVKACGVCRRSYDGAAWETLAIVTTLPSSSIQAYLSVPAGWSVELRRCWCGATLARRTE
jgi:hypothetical protein